MSILYFIYSVKQEKKNLLNCSFLSIYFLIALKIKSLNRVERGQSTINKTCTMLKKIKFPIIIYQKLKETYES